MPWKTNARRGSLGKYPCMILGTWLTMLNSYGGKIAFREGIVGSISWVYLESERHLRGGGNLIRFEWFSFFIPPALPEVYDVCPIMVTVRN